MSNGDRITSHQHSMLKYWQVSPLIFIYYAHSGKKTIQVQTLRFNSILYFLPTMYMLPKLKGYFWICWPRHISNYWVFFKIEKFNPKLSYKQKRKCCIMVFLILWLVYWHVHIIKQHWMLIDSKAINIQYLSVDKFYH